MKLEIFNGCGDSVLLVIAFLLLRAQSLPTSVQQISGDVKFIEDGISAKDLLSASDYLSKFNYLQSSLDKQHLEAAAALSFQSAGEILREPLLKFQRFFRLPESGILDKRTLQAMKRQRCGRPDPIDHDSTLDRNKRYVIRGAKWNKNNLTFRMLNYPSLHSRTNLRKNRVNWAVWNALKLWALVTPLRFQKVPATEHADIFIKFATWNHGDGYPFDGPDGTIGHAFLPDGAFGDMDGDIHLDDSELFNLHGKSGYDLYKVMTHELGHSLGLEHSSAKGSIMAPDYRTFGKKKFRLDDDDIRAVKVLYGYSTTEESNPGKDCDKEFGATIMIDDKLYIFKNSRLWILKTPGKLKTKSKGVLAKKSFPGIPSNIDCGYQRPIDKKVVIFKDFHYYLYTGSVLDPGYPRSIGDFGLPTMIDSIISLREFNKTYFFHDNEVYRYDEELGLVDEGYPHPVLDVFIGIHPPISAAFQFHDGYSYFITGKTYQRYSPFYRNADPGYPRHFGQDFINC